MNDVLSETLRTIYDTSPECFESPVRLYAMIFDHLAYEREILGAIKPIMPDVTREFLENRDGGVMDFEKLCIAVSEPKNNQTNMESQETQGTQEDQEVSRSPEEYYNLACACKTVKGIVDVESYKKNLKKASALGHCIAMHTVARLYLKGKYFDKDVSAALELFEKCAENGDPHCYYEMSDIYLRELNDRSRQIEYLKKAVDAGVNEALYDLAMIYYSNGTPQDFSTAADLFKRAVANNDINAMYQLALCYRYGHGVERNMTEAMELLKRAAQLGHSRAKEIIGG